MSLSLLRGNDASAQTIILNTIDTGPSSAQFVVESLKLFASKRKHSGQWEFKAGDCGDLQKLLNQERFVALTTSKCWLQLSQPGTELSASVGLVVQLFRGSVERASLAPDSKIGFAATAAGAREWLTRTLSDVVRSPVRVSASVTSHRALVYQLNSGFAIVGLIADGVSSREDFKAAEEERNVSLVSYPGVVTISTSNSLFVSPGRIRGGEEMHFPTEDAHALLFDENMSAADMWDIEDPMVETLKPLPVTLPILITKGDVQEIWKQFASAQLAAPLSALVNPCRGMHEQAYRGFLLSAVKDAGLASRVALWEHAALLESRKDRSEVFQTQKSRLEAGGLIPALSAVRQSLPKSTFSCDLPWRGEFGNKRLAYYQRAVNYLRKAPPNTDPDSNSFLDTSSREFMTAAVCLDNAFRVSEGAGVPFFRQKSGEAPSCRESRSGTWSTYYAPYLPALVIESEWQRRTKTP